jgi:hypothetical protein
MFWKALALLLFAVVPAAAQVQWRPTDPPLVTAAWESWFTLREPMNFAGELYYPTGPRRFFDGNTMARIGHYNAVPVYWDTTVEPYSILLVPASRGLMQPYEKVRRDGLAGTSGSRTPAFPARLMNERGVLAMTPVPPTGPPTTMGAIGVFTLEEERRRATRPAPEPAPAPPVIPPATATNLGAQARAGQPAVTTLNTASLRRPENNDGIWIRFRDRKWVSAGKAVPLRQEEFRKIGEYAGFPVFMRAGGDGRIYVPSREGVVAPYRALDSRDSRF